MAKRNVKNETKVVCPKCGAEFAIPEREHITIGIAIGKDSNLGTISPEVVEKQKPVSKALSQMKADAKIEALRKAGVNVDNLFSMKGANGGENVARLENGNLSVVSDDDPIYKSIIENGTVPNPRLFRRWVMAQVFHMMAYRGYNGDGFTAALCAKGYRYQWKMVTEELRVQARLYANDPENFKARNHWFDATCAAEMCADYIQKLHSHIKGLKVRRCKGVPYVRLRKSDVFVSDLQKKVYLPLIKLTESIATTDSPMKLHSDVCRFFSVANDIWMDGNTPMSSAFKDSYKGAGAYFTMKNLILFHNARFKNGCCVYSKEKSLQILEAKNTEYGSEGWRLFGVMKKLISDNNINIENKMAEWRK